MFVIVNGFGGRRTVVERLQIADADFCEHGVAALHFVDDPAEGHDDQFDIRDDRHDQMRKFIVDRHFHDFRIDQDEPQVLRRETVEERYQDVVQADGFAGTRRAGHEQMRRAGQIDDDVLSFDVASEHDGNLPFVRAERL